MLEVRNLLTGEFCFLQPVRARYVLLSRLNVLFCFQAKKQKISENRKHLANVRVVQRNLVFVVGLSPRLADQEVLRKAEYFGKFGRIHKVVINHSTSYAGNQSQASWSGVRRVKEYLTFGYVLYMTYSLRRSGSARDVESHAWWRSDQICQKYFVL